jgi:hypothetical protein
MLLVQDIYEQWVFTDTMQLGPQDPSLFTVPADCTATCASSAMNGFREPRVPLSFLN